MSNRQHPHSTDRTIVAPLVGALLALTFAATVAAQSAPAGQTAVPQLLPVTGTLVGPDGGPMSGVLRVTFAIYQEADGGVPIWTETQNVSVGAGGHFAVWVGAAGQGLPRELFQSGVARWMGVTPEGLPEQRRGRFVAVPYALNAVGAAAPVAHRDLPSESVSSAPSRQDPSPFEGVLDLVTPDDSIVQGSLCVGLDCVNNESFGFDTIRLKENNLRIHFEDTSVGTFPSNDWEITANDSASGGASYLGFMDRTAARTIFRMDAGAPANALKIGSNGKVGFRQANPVLDLHMTTGDTPAVRFEQSNASGYTAQTWDVAGNEANFFIRDVTGGSRLSFRIRPGAPTSSLDISATGNVGIGTASPTQKLDVNGSVRTTGTYLFGGGTLGLRDGGGGVVAFDAGSNYASGYRFGTSGDVYALVVNASGDVGLGVSAPAHAIHAASGAHLTAGGSWTNASSRAVKDRIAPLEPEAAAAALAALQPMTYVYRTEPSDGQVGFIAEDVPDLVATPDRKSLAAMDIVAVAVKVIQDQQQQLSQLRQASRTQEDELAALRTRLTELERLLGARQQQ